MISDARFKKIAKDISKALDKHNADEDEVIGTCLQFIAFMIAQKSDKKTRKAMVEAFSDELKYGVKEMVPILAAVRRDQQIADLEKAAGIKMH